MSCPARPSAQGSGSCYPRGLTLAPEWLCLWLGAEGYSSGDIQLPSYQVCLCTLVRTRGHPRSAAHNEGGAIAAAGVARSSALARRLTAHAVPARGSPAAACAADEPAPAPPPAAASTYTTQQQRWTRTIAAASSTSWADAMDFDAAMMRPIGLPALARCALDGTLRTSTSNRCSLSCSSRCFQRCPACSCSWNTATTRSGRWWRLHFLHSTG